MNVLSSKRTPKPAGMRDENCSPLNIVSDCSRTKAIRSTAIQRFKSPCNGPNFGKPGMPRFQRVQRSDGIFAHHRSNILTIRDRFSMAVSKIFGKRLTFASLTGKLGETSAF